MPGDTSATMMFNKNSKTPGTRGNDSALKAMNRTANAGGGESFAGASSHLHPISELGPQGGTLDASRGYNDQMIPYPQPMHVRSKMQKSGTKMRDSSSKGGGGGSMVLVMSNLMTKRKNGGSKRGGKSTKPASDAGMSGARGGYH